MLKILKLQLGEVCTYLSFSKEKIKNDKGCWEEKECIKAILKNDLGSKDIIRIPLNKKSIDLTPTDYQTIFFKLNSREYERNKSTI